MRNLIITSTLLVATSLLGQGAIAQTAKKSAKNSAKNSAKPAPQAAAKPAAAPMNLTQEQISLAQNVVTGSFPCGDGRSVSISADTKVNGAFDVSFGGSKYDVAPMPTKSGALRLEDTKTGFVLMQLANKSMLFNEKQGRRLADDCVSPAQQAFADNMKANPTAGVLDGGK